MAMLSLICCLLALSSSAFGRSTYGSYSSVPSMPMTVSGGMRDLPTQPKPTPLPVPSGYGQSQSGYGQQQPSYGQQPQHSMRPDVQLPTQPSGGLVGQRRTESFIPSGQQMELPMQRVIPTPSQLLLQQQQELLAKNQQAQIITEADVLCRGQAPETILPLDNGRRFVVCLEDGKGFEQQCPKGLVFHPETRRCERKLGPLENPCASQPCLNGGKCVQTDVSSFRCECPAGLDGTICELDARVCQTQQPCGQAPGTRCQSFRFGAALTHICILQDGLAYGLNAQQVQPSPCRDVDGPRPLAVSDKGFILCDGERLFIESCPGGTIWDDLNKACVWPDMQGIVSPSLADQKPTEIPRQLPTQSSYGQQPYSYGQKPQVPLMESPKIHSRVIPSTLQGYGSRPQPMQQFDNQYQQQEQIPQQQGQFQQQQQDQLPQQQQQGQIPQQQQQGQIPQQQQQGQFQQQQQQPIDIPKHQSYGGSQSVQKQWPQPVPQQWPQPKPQVWQPTGQRLQDVRPIPQQTGY